jgi:hypothetical protein
MDTLKGLVYIETCKGVDVFCLAVEDPNDSNKTRIFKGKERKANEERKFSKKRGGSWKFKAFRLIGKIENVEIVERSISQVIPNIPEDLYQQIPLSELKKLKEWTD